MEMKKWKEGKQAAYIYVMKEWLDLKAFMFIAKIALRTSTVCDLQ